MQTPRESGKGELGCIIQSQADLKSAIATLEWDWLAASEALEEANSRV